jgi:hypothetical protein
VKLSPGGVKNTFQVKELKSAICFGLDVELLVLLPGNLKSIRRCDVELPGDTPPRGYLSRQWPCRKKYFDDFLIQGPVIVMHSWDILL